MLRNGKENKKRVGNEHDYNFFDQLLSNNYQIDGQDNEYNEQIDETLDRFTQIDTFNFDI